MRVLIIAHKVPYPPRGGATLRIFNLIKECSKNNEIHLITFTQEPYLRDPDKVQESIVGLKRYCKEVKVFKIPTDSCRLSWYLLLFLNLFSLTPYSVWRFWSPKMVKAVKEHLKKYTFDLMEIGSISLTNYVKLTPQLPKLLIHHNIESQLLLRRSRIEKKWLAKAYLAFQAFKLRRLEERACKFFDYHTTVSELDKETLEHLVPGLNIAVVDNGVDTEYFKPQDVSVEENTLVYAGGMTWYPNVEAMRYFVKEIWPLLKQEIPSIKMNLIGADPPKELLDLNRKDPAFNIIGFVDDVRPHVLRSAVYVVPITVGGGTRLKILDAMAMGKAIVSTSIGCEGIEVKNGRDIIIADDPQEFVRKTVNLLRDKKLRDRLGAMARKTAVNLYSWKKIAPELERVYSHLANVNKK